MKGGRGVIGENVCNLTNRHDFLGFNDPSCNFFFYEVDIYFKVSGPLMENGVTSQLNSKLVVTESKEGLWSFIGNLAKETKVQCEEVFQIAIWVIWKWINRIVVALPESISKVKDLVYSEAWKDMDVRPFIIEVCLLESLFR
ncbi:hypothetical protein Tco_0706236 [Tanacetum coccineum]|uniref:Uncharacterized protein n=1 Tax=Tanacetum coccineum TaxID=301880 RepID=A0ABQ4Y6Y4_9ASTR